MGRFLAVVSLLLLSLVAECARSFPRDGASSADTLYRVTLKDGSSLVGQILEQRADSIRFRLASGAEVTFAVSGIEEIRTLTGEIVEGVFRTTDPNRTRLFFGPTARPLRSGEGYFAAYEIFFPFLAVGIADVLTIAGGITLFPGADQQLFYIAPKIGVPIGSENTHLAAGVLYLAGTSGSEDAVGIVYGAGTFGSPRAAVTAGLGYGFAEGEFAQDPVILLGGEAQISNSIKLISENWIPIGADYALLSLGIRFFGERLAADLGFFYPTGTETEGFPFLPWIGFVYNFGGR